MHFYLLPSYSNEQLTVKAYPSFRSRVSHNIGCHNEYQFKVNFQFLRSTQWKMKAVFFEFLRWGIFKPKNLSSAEPSISVPRSVSGSTQVELYLMVTWVPYRRFYSFYSNQFQCLRSVIGASRRAKHSK